MSLHGKTIAVTGAGGFIGSAVVPALVAAGAHIRALSGPPNLILPPLPEATVEMRGEITQIETTLELCEGAQIVVHLAGPPSVAESFARPVDYAKVHILGTLAVLQACHLARVRRFIYLSSAEVYGRPQSSPVSENHPVSARSPYGACKIAAEQFIRAHAISHKLEVVILRPFSIYGPAMSPLSLIGTLFRQVCNEEGVSVHDLRPIRDYCYVDDLVRAIQLACAHETQDLLTLNIGSGQGISVRDLVSTLLMVLGRDLPIQELADERRPNGSEILELVADLSKTRQVLGWTPVVGLREGLQRVALTQNLVRNAGDISRLESVFPQE